MAGVESIWKLHTLIVMNSCEHTPVADLGGVSGVQVHPPLVASNVFLRT